MGVQQFGRRGVGETTTHVLDRLLGGSALIANHGPGIHGTICTLRLFGTLGITPSPRNRRVQNLRKPVVQRLTTPFSCAHRRCWPRPVTL